MALAGDDIKSWKCQQFKRLMKFDQNHDKGMYISIYAEDAGERIGIQADSWYLVIWKYIMLEPIERLMTCWSRLLSD